MPSPLTENRERKRLMLLDVIDCCIDLIGMDNKDRDIINMAEYKELLRKVKEMSDKAKNVKSASENFTKDSEKCGLIVMGGQENVKETNLQEK